MIVICGSEAQYRSFCQVLQRPDLVDDPRFASIAQRQPHPTAGEVTLCANPIRFSGSAPPLPSAPPTIGQHTDEILREVLGLDDAAIAALRQRRVV